VSSRLHWEVEGTDCPRRGCLCEKSKRSYVYGLAGDWHQDQIARSCSIGQANRPSISGEAQQRRLTWPLPEELDEQRLDELLFPTRPLRAAPQFRPGIDFAHCIPGFKRISNLTLQLLWEEYRETHPDGYGYSRFCELYQRWSRTAMSCSRTITNPEKPSSTGPRHRAGL